MKPAIPKSFLTRTIGLIPGQSYSDELKKENGEPTEPRKKKTCHNRKLRAKLIKDDPFCYYCSVPLTLDNSTLDHAIPRSKGGTDEYAVLACYECNQDKGDKIVIPWHLNRRS